MLPNRMQLPLTVENQLRQLKQHTAISPNVSARLAFFRSVESGFTYNPEEAKKLDGSLALDKITWLGETQLITEQVLKLKYGEIDEKELAAAWAAHVEDGIASIRGYKTVMALSEAI